MAEGREPAGQGREAGAAEAEGGGEERVNDDVLRRELRRIAVEANHRCFGCGFEHSCSLHGCAIIREALKRLAPEEANEPLTPEQLREAEKARL